jgi:hypothetical protein
MFISINEDVEIYLRLFHDAKYLDLGYNFLCKNTFLTQTFRLKKMILLCYFKDFIYADLQYPVGVTY